MSAKTITNAGGEVGTLEGTSQGVDRHESHQKNNKFIIRLRKSLGTEVTKPRSD